MLGAGCPRVTHPFAARAPHPKVWASLDLHVLSTPPAFVLSQDQTLREGLFDTAAGNHRSQNVDTESRRLRDAIAGSCELVNCSMYQRNRSRPSLKMDADEVMLWH